MTFFCRHGAAGVRRPPHSRKVLLPLDHEAFQSRRQDRIPVGSCRRHPQSTNVPKVRLLRNMLKLNWSLLKANLLIPQDEFHWSKREGFLFQSVNSPQPQFLSKDFVSQSFSFNYVTTSLPLFQGYPTIKSEL